MIAVSLHLTYSLSSRVHLFFSIYFFFRDDVEVAIEVSGSVCVLKKPGGGKNKHSVFEVFSRADVHFKSKPIKVVGKEGDPFFNFSTRFKNKCSVVYIEHA